MIEKQLSVFSSPKVCLCRLYSFNYYIFLQTNLHALESVILPGFYDSDKMPQLMLVKMDEVTIFSYGVQRI